MIRRPPRSTLSSSSAASDVYKRQVIFVVDSNDVNRVELAKKELDRLLTDPMLSGATLLVLCNKQDLPNRLTPNQIVDAFGFRGSNAGAVSGRNWFLQGCCAHSGEGLFDGLDWLCKHLPNQ
eukprot:TRINITY_DN6759_c0_g1_i1.p1 TRINITY_DN6759_c0_g1~~TRINITY_DN6759_c0_g1_i1.p1  ORF type:complete len:122 (-),score=22.96 TRINITY_DN6759_c0_g1_i1:175-540(-)